MRLVLITAAVVAALVGWIEVLVRDPTTAAIMAAVALAFLDYWRRKRRLKVRQNDR